MCRTFEFLVLGAEFLQILGESILFIGEILDVRPERGNRVFVVAHRFLQPRNLRILSTENKNTTKFSLFLTGNISQTNPYMVGRMKGPDKLSNSPRLI
jgi:hypothetical protein